MPLNFNDTIFDTLSSSMGEVFPELISVFFQETESSLQAMETNIATNDIDGIRDIAHKLKSSTKSFGATSLVEILERIESSKHFEKADLISEKQKLMDEYTLVKRHILTKSTI